MGIKRAAEIICERNGVSGEEALRGYVQQLCILSANNDAFLRGNCCLNTTHSKHHWTGQYFKGEQVYSYGAGMKGQLPLLTAAAYLNCIPLVKELIEKGYNAQIGMQMLGSPARAAAIKGNVEVLELLLGSSISAPSERLRAIDGAIAASQLATLESALSFQYCNFADCPAITFTWVHALRKFCFRNLDIFSRIEIVLSQHKYSVHASLPSFLAKAIACDESLDMVKHLLQKGAPVNRSPAQKDQDNEPLRRAARYGSAESMKLLLQKGADVEGRVFDLKPRPLSYAAARGHLEMVRILLDFGADPNAGSPPPIVSAVRLEHAAMFKLLRRRGAIFGNSESGVVALRDAVVSGLESMVVLLLEDGARCGGQIVLAAVQNQQYDIAQILRQHQEAVLANGSETQPHKRAWKLLRQFRNSLHVKE
jgi:hypothetical protein